MTKKDLLEAIKDMSEDAQCVMITSKGNIIHIDVKHIMCDTKNNMIALC